MKIALNTPIRKWLTAATVLPVVVYFGLAARDLAASWLGDRPELKSLQRAAWLDPRNADYRNHVGRYYDLVARDPQTAIRYYKEAVQLNPHSARYWFDLAGAYQILGDTPNQTAALEHAIEADATTPDVAWEAANLYLVQGENEKALREFSVVLANDSSLAPSAVNYCWRISPDVDRMLAEVVPHTAEGEVAFLNFLLTKEETAATFKVWDALMETNQSFDRRMAYDYFQYLVLHKEPEEAVLVWKETARRFGLSSYLPVGGNLVVNGMFNYDPLNAGLDWRYNKQAAVNLTLDPTDYHAGRRSLLINFDGPGISDAGIFQLIAVQPNTTYEFSGYYKNGEIEGAGGPHFTIQDMYTQAVYYESDELKEGGFWKSVTSEFTTGPDSRMIMFHIRRLPAGSPIRGKLWIDDFRITRKPS